MQGRPAIAYVVEVDGSEVLLNLHESHRGQIASHSEGVSLIGQPGDFIGANAGTELIVLRVLSVAFAEPKEVHKVDNNDVSHTSEPLRQIRSQAVGYLKREYNTLKFEPETWRLPPLGAEVFPLTSEELHATIGAELDENTTIRLGWDSRNEFVPVDVDVNALLSRHAAILGSTGQGKTHFISAIVQDLLRFNNARVVIFDINGEYATAFNKPEYNSQVTELGGTGQNSIKIPYYALGRHGLSRLLLPSEKSQLPALRFAIENLQFVEADAHGARLVNQTNNTLFDDCRRGQAQDAFNAINQIRQGQATTASQWPHMRALSCLAAEWYCLQPDSRSGTPERSAFLYGHVQTLINRTRGLIEDERFQDVVDVTGGQRAGRTLDWRSESQVIVERIFGPVQGNNSPWRVHIIDLSKLTQDLMPFVLGALLELFTSELFSRGPAGTHPTLLVLEEAHHYLRQLPGDAETGQHSLAYERLAKEGRKFGLSLLVSTQRPSEVSPTVLSQCGTWCVFRLTNDSDQKTIGSASEWSSGYMLRQIPGLPRGQAIVFGASIPIPCRVKVIRPDPNYTPSSLDSNFVSTWS